MFICLAIPNIISSPLFAKLGAKYGNILIIGIGILLLGCISPSIGFSDSIALKATSLSFYGIAYSMATVPQTVQMAELANRCVKKPYARIYAILGIFYNLGAMCGSFMGSFILKVSSFKWIMISSTIMLLGTSTLLIAHVIVKKHNDRATTFRLLLSDGEEVAEI
jgi:MFS family permease